MAWRWTRTDTLDLTRELACQIADLPHFEGDRPWSNASGRNRMSWLSQLVDEGRFYPPRWATAEYNGITYRVNGGTSSNMLAAKQEFPDGLVVVIDRFLCDGMLDVSDLFCQFDHHASTRTLIQRVRAQKPSEPLLSSVSPTDINLIVTGVGAAMLGFGPVRSDDKIDLIHDHAVFVAWASTIVKQKRLRLQGVCAAMFDTYNISKTFAKQFWSEVAEESNVDNKSPSRLLSLHMHSQCGASPSKKDPPVVLYNKCCQAWNAARSNDTVTFSKRKIDLI